MKSEEIRFRTIEYNFFDSHEREMNDVDIEGKSNQYDHETDDKVSGYWKRVWNMDGYRYASYINEVANDVYSKIEHRPVVSFVFRYCLLLKSDELIKVMVSPKDKDKDRLENLEYYYREI